MTLREVVSNLGLEVLAPGAGLGTEIGGAYCSDLLSDVLAHARPGDLWITLQTHVNVIAVASMKELAAVVLVNGRKPEEDILFKAIEERVAVLLCSLPAFEIAGRLYAMGIRGKV